MKRVVYHRLAAAELIESVQFYDERRATLGDEFLRAVDAVSVVSHDRSETTLASAGLLHTMFQVRWYSCMPTSPSWLTQMIALPVWLAMSQGLAADRREWVMLTNCQYVAHADNDGDSFRVRGGTNEFLLRLYFVDAPEINLRYPERTREQSEYFGVTLDESMKGGRMARDLVRETLRYPFTVWTRWASAAGRSKEPRYYGFVLVGTNALDELLVAKGLAQPKGLRPNLPTGQKAAAHLVRLEALEAGARKQRVGLWGTPFQCRYSHRYDSLKRFDR